MFIYVFDEETRDELIRRGYRLFSSSRCATNSTKDGHINFYTFYGDSDYATSTYADISDLKFVRSNTLTF